MTTSKHLQTPVSPCELLEVTYHIAKYTKDILNCTLNQMHVNKLPLTLCLRVVAFDSCVQVHWLSLLQEHKTANGRRDLQNSIILIKNPENQGEFFCLQSCQSVSHQVSLILVPLCLYEFNRNATWIQMKGDNLSVIN